MARNVAFTLSNCGPRALFTIFATLSLGCVPEIKMSGQRVLLEQVSSPALSSDVLAGKEFLNGGGTKVVGTLAAPISSQICAGVTVLGALGSGACTSAFGDFTGSDIHRDPATAQITVKAERTAVLLGAGYREVPDILKDDEGYWTSGRGCTGGGGSAQTCTPVTIAVRPVVTCGTSQGSLALRIANCTSLNAGSATWTGSSSGNAGQATWRLVTRTATSKEVWQDQRTGLLWSDVVGTDNWCRGAGNAQITDPANLCNNAGNQDQVTPISYCAEVAGTQPGIGTEIWASGVYDDTKGGMGANSSVAVRWRLPTIYDFHQAEVDGIRMVLPGMNSNHWSATIVSNFRSFAYSYDPLGGTGSNGGRNTAAILRCVGR